MAEPHIVITKPKLRAALLEWEKAFRDGKTRTVDETRALPVEQVATESSEHLWKLLDK